MHRPLESPRTHLAPFSDEDADELLSVFRDPAVRRYLLDDMVVPDTWIADEIDASDQRFVANGAGLWSVRLDPAGPIIGFAGFRPFFDPPELQLLYGFLPDHWGVGLATEVATLLRDHAFEELGFEELRAATDTPNAASSRVLERIGMKRTDTTADREGGTRFYTLMREEWEAARASGPEC